MEPPFASCGRSYGVCNAEHGSERNTARRTSRGYAEGLEVFRLRVCRASDPYGRSLVDRDCQRIGHSDRSRTRANKAVDEHLVSVDFHRHRLGELRRPCDDRRIDEPNPPRHDHVTDSCSVCGLRRRPCSDISVGCVCATGPEGDDHARLQVAHMARGAGCCRR